METIEVKVGQVWQDADPRDQGRYLRVVETTDTHAIVMRTDRHGAVWGKERRTRIRLDRFRPTSNGYRLIQDAPEER